MGRQTDEEYLAIRNHRPRDPCHQPAGVRIEDAKVTPPTTISLQHHFVIEWDEAAANTFGETAAVTAR
jgi:hypothetical protein